MASHDSIRRARPLLGTFVEIEIAGARRSDLNAVIDAAFDAVTLAHRLMSFHEPASDLSRLNREAANVAGLDTRHIVRLGIPDRFIEHAERSELLADLGLDLNGICQAVRSRIGDRSLRFNVQGPKLSNVGL